MKEIWKDVKGYEGLYQVSNLSRVRSLSRYVKNIHSKKIINGRIMKQTKTIKGYLRVTFSVNQKSKSFLVHRLVANSFIPNPNNYRIINHKDEDPSNNTIKNLEWWTYKYNTNYGNTIEKIKSKNTNGKLSKKVYQYDLDGNLIKEWPSASECRRNGFSQGHVCACCRGERKSHMGFKWFYYEV